jgi:hypothetical protein
MVVVPTFSNIHSTRTDKIMTHMTSDYTNMSSNIEPKIYSWNHRKVVVSSYGKQIARPQKVSYPPFNSGETD